MQENENMSAGAATEAAPEQPQTDAGATNTGAAPTETEDITYHAVQKDGNVTAIWEMQGRRHLRTIDPRSREGQEILRLFTAEQE